MGGKFHKVADMYKVFNVERLNILVSHGKTDRLLETTGKCSFASQKKQMSQLASYLNPDGSLSAGDLAKDWFPEVNADIFISHSHSDKEEVYRLVGLLKKCFNLNCFVDSLVWEYANDLLRQIDETYCLMPGNQYFDYNKRNYSTSAVHMMLSLALAKMIAKTKCVFFYNTPQSIIHESAVKKPDTTSPWIYNEIVIANMLEQAFRAGQESVMSQEVFSNGRLLEKSLSITYPIDLSNSITINNDLFKTWLNCCSERGQGALAWLIQLADEPRGL